ncbi:MAG: hypothetical protein KDA38_03985 [Planctomycetales bacterium]|nr:hypothetical protein [Planctomycetales bacterium]MCA9219798.1 hypothetical protein [Planctomycetales bacterium]
MSREEFFAALEAKVERATEGWPDWKHEVLRNSFRSANSTPRQVVVVKKVRSEKDEPMTSAEQEG